MCAAGTQVKALEAADAARRKEAQKAAERAQQRQQLEQQKAERAKRAHDARVRPCHCLASEVMGLPGLSCCTAFVSRLPRDDPSIRSCCNPVVFLPYFFDDNQEKMATFPRAFTVRFGLCLSLL
jgi:hypothetical protein